MRAQGWGSVEQSSFGASSAGPQISALLRFRLDEEVLGGGLIATCTVGAASPIRCSGDVCTTSNLEQVGSAGVGIVWPFFGMELVASLEAVGQYSEPLRQPFAGLALSLGLGGG